MGGDASLVFVAFLISVLLPWAYYALFEAGKWQATPGKRLLGVYVTDLNGNRISFGRSTGRFLSKSSWILIFVIVYLVSKLILGGMAFNDEIAIGVGNFISGLASIIGFIMAGLTLNKQALHDMIAGTLVYRGRAEEHASEARILVEPKLSSSNSSVTNWVFAGFGAEGDLVRITFSSDDVRLSTSGLVVGRSFDNCDLYISDPSVSRQHARFRKEGGKILIEDLGSTNGVSINGRNLKKKSTVEVPTHGELTIGGVELTIGKY